MGKKKFIDKKKAATFALVFKESFEGGDIGAERVFARVDNGPAEIPGFEEWSEEEPDEVDDSIFADAEEDSDETANNLELKHPSGRADCSKTSTHERLNRKGLPDHLRQQLLDLGFADDGYNYMQHLRTVGRSGGSSQFVPTTRHQFDSLRPDVKAYDASEVQIEAVYEGEDPNNTPMKVSSKTRQIRRPQVKNEGFDLDILAALENSDGSEWTNDVLGDDFVIVANEICDDNMPSSSDRNLQTRDKLSSVDPEPDWLHKEIPHIEDITEGVKSRPPRLLDEQFEMLAVREYNEGEFVEPEEPDALAKGHANISQFDSVLSEFLCTKSTSAEKYDLPMRTRELNAVEINRENNGCTPYDTKYDMDSKVKAWGPPYQAIPEGSELEEELVWVEDISEDGEEQWDCESVVSNYSNLENHPAKICTPSFRTALNSAKPTTKYIQLGGPQKLPMEFVPAKGQFEKLDGKFRGKTTNSEKTKPLNAHSEGKKLTLRAGETPEERKARKAAVKEERREARKVKKDLKLKYKGESQKAQLSAAVMGPPAIHLP